MSQYEPAPQPRLRIWLMAFAAFFLITGAWSFAAPYDGTPDEIQHALRAYGVVSGEIAPTLVADEKTSGALHDVPAGLVRDNCWRFKPEVSAACANAPGGDNTLVSTNVLAGRYNPLYYAVVGWPLKIWPNMTGVIGARLISAAGIAALLASAFALAAGTRRRLYLGAFAVAFTPIVAQMGGAINPNGWEIAAGAAFFASAIAIFLDRKVSSLAFWLLGISGTLMLVLRSAGIFLFAVALLSVLMPLGIGGIKEWWQLRPLRYVLGGWVLAGVFAGVWMLLMRPNQFGAASANMGYNKAEILFEELDRWENYLKEFVGIMSYLDTPIPGPFYAIWQVLAGLLVVLAVITTNRTGLWRIGILVVGGGLLPSLMQMAFVNDSNWVLQSRYMMPAMIGLPLICAHLIETSGTTLPSQVTARVARAYALILVPLHVVFLIFTMLRWQYGHGFNPLRGHWLPGVGPVVPLLLSVLGIVTLAATIWWLISEFGKPAPALAAEDAFGGELPPQRRIDQGLTVA